MRLLLPPVLPYRGTRGLDAFGAGGFGAPRRKAGKAYQHKGLDFIAEPGDTIIAPFGAIVEPPGLAYADSNLGSVHLIGLGDWDGWLLKLLYVAQREGLKHVAPGDPIGLAQAVAAYHEAKTPNVGHMTNHVHLELRGLGVLTDPTPYIKVPEAS